MTNTFAFEGRFIIYNFNLYTEFLKGWSTHTSSSVSQKKMGKLVLQEELKTGREHMLSPE